MSDRFVNAALKWKPGIWQNTSAKNGGTNVRQWKTGPFGRQIERNGLMLIQAQ
jgi:hypothetical protein